MIPRIQSGSSFAGAGLYYLHDKKREGESERLTTDRVAWTHAINTSEEDPEQVLAEMRQTAFDQPLLKFMAGHGWGSTMEKPVMTIALAWEHDRQLSKEQMIDAGESYLKHMGWHEHQALFVCHDDTKHQHVHLIVNKVNPTTGLGLSESFSKWRTHQWCLAYERTHGGVVCEARVGKYEGRESSIQPSHMPRKQWELWQKISQEGRADAEHVAALQAGEWDTIKAGQKAERIDYFKETARQRKELRGVVYKQAREEFKGEWADYAVRRTELAKEKTDYDRQARLAMRHFSRLHALASGRRQAYGQGVTIRPEWRGAEGAKAIKLIKERQVAYHAGVKAELQKTRSDIQKRQKARTEQLAKPALTAFERARAEGYKGLLKEHRDDRAQLTRDQKAGTRRPDVLPGPAPANQNRQGLDPQLMQRVRAAVDQTLAQQKTGKELTGRADPRAEQTARDPRQHEQARTEQTASKVNAQARESHKEKTTKEIEREYRRAQISEMVADRQADRRRGGGRSRDR
ncbi:MAG: relaxase/mobilization nuclease domain-containing protein [Alphaproteobacteria bacterium]|nr:relaxase/mobilization nuclease domain-containing protein [Alphaproteobacteria bacterium]